MTSKGMINVTDCDLKILISTAYKLSAQQGLGYFDPDGNSDNLTPEIVDEILAKSQKDSICVISMDYVNGRAVKMTVFRKEAGLFIENHWFDHNDDQLRKLLVAVGLEEDLIEKARAEYEAFVKDCCEKAKEIISQRGGQLPDLDINAGTREILWAAYTVGGVKYTTLYRPDIHRIWELSQ